MRMWGVDPKLMCRQHLLGEHVEMHMFVGSILAGTSLLGYTFRGLVDTTKIRKRHAELMLEMRRRGMNHNSPLPAFEYKQDPGMINVQVNLRELARRCPGCHQLQNSSDSHLLSIESNLR